MAKEGIQIFSHVVNEGDSPTLFIGLVGSKECEADLIHFEEIGLVADGDGGEVSLVTKPMNLLNFLKKVGFSELADRQFAFEVNLAQQLLEGKRLEEK